MGGNKPGYKTTEFWLVAIPGAITTVLQLIGQSGLTLPGWAGPAMAAAYAVARGLAKMQTPSEG